MNRAQGIAASLIILASASSANAQTTLSVPLVIQAQSNWCWAAASEMIGKFYGGSDTQYTIAAWAFYDTSPPANLPNEFWAHPTNPNRYNMEEIALHFSNLNDTQYLRALSMSEVKTEINYGKPFYMGIQATDNSWGHVVVCNGYNQNGSQQNDVIYNDPTLGAEVMDIGAFTSNSTWTWTQTMTLHVQPLTPTNVAVTPTMCGFSSTWTDPNGRADFQTAAKAVPSPSGTSYYSLKGGTSPGFTSNALDCGTQYQVSLQTVNPYGGSADQYGTVGYKSAWSSPFWITSGSMPVPSLTVEPAGNANTALGLTFTPYSGSILARISIERMGPGTTPWTEIASVTSGGSYLDTSVIGAQLYTYRVRYVGTSFANQTSAYSATASGIPFAIWLTPVVLRR